MCKPKPFPRQEHCSPHLAVRRNWQQFFSAYNIFGGNYIYRQYMNEMTFDRYGQVTALCK